MPLQLRLQISRIEAHVRDAGPGRGAGKLAGQEEIADFALPIVERDASVLWSAVVGQIDAVGLRRDDIDGRGAGPGDADAAFGGGSGRLHEDGLQKSIQQVGSEAVGAELEVVAVGVCAAFGREHDLCGVPRFRQPRFKYKCSLSGREPDVPRHYSRVRLAVALGRGKLRRPA